MRAYWYPLCRSDDLPPHRPLAATLLGDPLVLFRDETGAPRCLADLCPHRSAPLSLGRVEAGRVECPYHGWQFDGAGACVHIPSVAAGLSMPERARVRRYPCVVRAGLVWVWPGDPSQADDAATWGCDDTDSRALVTGVRDLDVDHGLVIENLLDLAHAPFTHDGTLATRADRCGLDVHPATTDHGLRARFRRTDDDCLNAQSVAFEAPCTVRFDDDDHGPTQTHRVVPLGPRRTRWFWEVTREGLLASAALDALLAARAAAIVEQDVRLLLAQQARIDQGAPPWGCVVPADAAARAYRAWRTRHEGADTWFAGFAPPCPRG
jgi:chlorophyllide a oxygenase